jgi:hypothetical protein
MNSQIWYYRPNRTPCSLCDNTYIPHDDRQRFCYHCREWFHIHCLLGEDEPNGLHDFSDIDDHGPLDTTTLGQEGFPLVFEEVVSRPAVRGHGGDYSYNNNWLTTGSGVQKALISKWTLVEKEVPEDWMKQLGENFLEDFVWKTWEMFSCVKCSDRI